MNTKDIIAQVKIKLDKGEICNEYYDKMLQNGTVEQLCKMWFSGSDWAIENKFPDLNVLRSFKGKSDEFGIFTDKKGIVLPLHKMAFFGDSNVKLHIDNYAVCQIYLFNNSQLEIYSDETCIIEVNIYDNAKFVDDHKCVILNHVQNL